MPFHFPFEQREANLGATHCLNGIQCGTRVLSGAGVTDGATCLVDTGAWSLADTEYGHQYVVIISAIVMVYRFMIDLDG
jgi:hypothetical protein